MILDSCKIIISKISFWSLYDISLIYLGWVTFTFGMSFVWGVCVYLSHGSIETCQVKKKNKMNRWYDI